MNEEKRKALDAVLAQIEKAYGKGAIMNSEAMRAIPILRSFPRGVSRSTWRWAWAGFPVAEW